MELGGVGNRSEDREMLQQDLESVQTLRGQRKAVKFKLGKGQPNIPGENNHRHAMKEGLRKDLPPPSVPWGWFPSYPPATSPLLPLGTAVIWASLVPGHQEAAGLGVRTRQPTPAPAQSISSHPEEQLCRMKWNSLFYFTGFCSERRRKHLHIAKNRFVLYLTEIPSSFPAGNCRKLPAGSLFLSR